MLTHPTLDQMAALGLTGMADAWNALNDQDADQGLDRNEWLGLMLDREATYRADKRFANRLRNAKMRFPNACIEDVDFSASRGLDRRKVLSLAQGDWIKAQEQIILTAQTGTGKTWLSCAFAHQAAQLPVSGWHAMIGEPTVADAILDRIVHNAHRIELKGDSMHRKDRTPDLTENQKSETMTS